MTMKNNDPTPMGCSKNSSKREVYSNTILLQETRNMSNKQPKLTPKGIRKRRENKTQSCQKEKLRKLYHMQSHQKE